MLTQISEYLQRKLTRRDIGFLAAFFLARRSAKADVCSDYINRYCPDSGAPDVPGPLLAAWLVHTTGHCLDDFLFGQNSRTDIWSCMGLNQASFTFLAKKFSGQGLSQTDQNAIKAIQQQTTSPVVAAFQIVGVIWSSILNDCQICGIFPQQFQDQNYSDHACPRTSDIFYLGQTGVFPSGHAKQTRSKAKHPAHRADGGQTCESCR